MSPASRAAGRAQRAEQEPPRFVICLSLWGRDKPLPGPDVLKSRHLETGGRSSPALAWVMLRFSASGLGIGAEGSQG